MNLFEDIVFVNKSAAKKTIKSFKKSWLIIFTGLAYSIINILLMTILSVFFKGVLQILAGFILAIASAMLISNYLYLLFNIINYDRISMQDFKDGFKAFLWDVYGVLFVFWIASLLLSPLYRMAGENAVLLGRIITLLILFALNPLPETIYQKSYSSFESISYAFEFMKENWLNWLIPNIVFHYLIYLTTGSIVLDVFATPLNLGFGLNFSPKGIGLYLLGQIIFSITMIYRGHLFKLLSTSTRNKRIYMRNMYK